MGMKKITCKNLAELASLAGRFRQLEEEAGNQKVNGINAITLTQEGIKYFKDKLYEIVNSEL